MYPENSTPSTAQQPSSARLGLAVAGALAVTIGLTAAWGVLSGATQYHFVYAAVLVGVVPARVLTGGGARQRWLPFLAGVLAFSVGFFGDVLAVALALVWHDGVPAGTVMANFGEVFRNVNSGHSLTDWAFFILAALVAAGFAASRQITGNDPIAVRMRAARSRRG